MAGTASANIHTTLTDAQGHPHTATPRGSYLAILSLTALGIVYGDIGTSPLYAMRECFHGPHAIEATPANVFGVLSLIFWALILIISIKYCVFVLRADNHSEGSILALTALATPIKIVSRSEKRLLVVLGIFGAALLYGDGIITPAISVLGAVDRGRRRRRQGDARRLHPPGRRSGGHPRPADRHGLRGRRRRRI